MFKLEKDNHGIWCLEDNTHHYYSRDLESILDDAGIESEHITITDVKPMEEIKPLEDDNLEQRVLVLLGKDHTHLNSSAQKAG